MTTPYALHSSSFAWIHLIGELQDMCQYIGSLLDRYCDFEQYADGALALAQLQARPKDFDLVLSDDLMPNLSGSELIDAIRADEHLQAIPVIMVSASTGDQARMDGLARGADDYLSKPFQARELILRVHTQLQTVSIRNKLELQMAEYFRELEESRVSFTRLCERLQVGIHRSDPDGNIVW
jgi:DNA-binding response OmpR family regulator